jgi:hypothetical protein
MDTRSTVITRRKIDETCAAVAKGNGPSELALFLEGFTRETMATLQRAVEKRLPVTRAGVMIAEVEGVPVYGDCIWKLYDARTESHVRECTERERQLLALAHAGIAIELGGITSLFFLRREIDAAKELMAKR